MKKTLLSLFMVACVGTAVSYGQVNVGSTTPPDASVALQVSGTNLGFMPPKVSLTSTDEFGLAGDTKTAGIMVYNTNTALASNFAFPSYGVGLYLWTGKGWLWQGPMPFISALAPASGNIPVGTVDVPLNVSGPDHGVGNPDILPTVDGGAVVATVGGNYKYELDGYIAQAPDAPGSIVFEVQKNGAYSTQFQVPVAGQTNNINIFHFSEEIYLAAGDKLTFKVIQNNTGKIVSYVYIPNIVVKALELGE